MTRETPGDWVKKAAGRGLSPEEMIRLYHLAALAKKEDAKATLWSVIVVIVAIACVVGVFVGVLLLWRL